MSCLPGPLYNIHVYMITHLPYGAAVGGGVWAEGEGRPLTLTVHFYDSVLSLASALFPAPVLTVSLTPVPASPSLPRLRSVPTGLSAERRPTGNIGQGTQRSVLKERFRLRGLTVDAGGEASKPRVIHI